MTNKTDVNEGSAALHCYPSPDSIFVGSWGTTGGNAACGRCGGKSKTGVNITIENAELNLCNRCAVDVADQISRAMRERREFDDIRQGDMAG